MRALLMLGCGVLVAFGKAWAQRRVEAEELPYYREKGNFLAGAQIYFWGGPRLVASSKQIGFSLTPMRMVEAGVALLYYAKKPYVMVESPSTHYASEWQEDARVNHLAFFLTGAYHLQDVLARYLKVSLEEAGIDPYARVMLGFNTAFGKPPDAVKQEKKTLRARLALGAGVFITPAVMLFGEVGVSSYGWGSVGVRWRFYQVYWR